MKIVSKIVTTASVVCLAAALAAAGPALAGKGAKGHGHGDSDETAYGMPGDPKKKSRVVEISMNEGEGTMSFKPNLITVKKGEQIHFKLKNTGELDHEIVVATLAENLKHAKEMERFPDMEHVDANARRVKPKGSDEMLWRFTKVGEFDMSCLIPGHREAGMTGKVIVK